MEIHRNMAAWDRAISIGIGSALVVYALKHKRQMGSMTTGIGLLARGVAGVCPGYAATGFRTLRDDAPERALSGSGGVRLKESVTIAAPPDEVYGFWTDYDNLPSFIRHLVGVERLGEGRTRWTMRGPAGLPLQWDAEIINEIPSELIAWKSLPGADVVSAGSVTFKPSRRGGTVVTVNMQYDAPAGRVGRAIGWLAGYVPSSELREDLRRLKQMIEAGELSSTAEQPSGPRSRKFAAAKWATS